MSPTVVVTSSPRRNCRRYYSLLRQYRHNLQCFGSVMKICMYVQTLLSCIPFFYFSFSGRQTRGMGFANNVFLAPVAGAM